MSDGGSAAVFTVAGMTCGHCASHVQERVGKIHGVRSVEVDVAAGRVAVTSDTPLSTQDIAAAVTDAGYQLVS